MHFRHSCYKFSILYLLSQISCIFSFYLQIFTFLKITSVGVPYFSIGFAPSLILAGPLYYEKYFEYFPLVFRLRVVIWDVLALIFQVITPTLTMYFFRFSYNFCNQVQFTSLVSTLLLVLYDFSTWNHFWTFLC